MKTTLAIGVSLLAIDPSSSYSPFLVGSGRQPLDLLSTRRSDEDASFLEEWSTPQLLRALDRRLIPYPATASRRELQDLWIREVGRRRKKRRSEPSSASTTPNDLDDDDDHLEARYRKRHQRRSSRSSTLEQDFLNPLVSASSDMFNAGYRQARQWKRRVSDAWAVDPTTGVRTVRYTKRPTRRSSTPSRRPSSENIRRDTIREPLDLVTDQSPRRSSAARQSRAPLYQTSSSSNITTTNDPSSAAIVLSTSLPSNETMVAPRRSSPRRRRRQQQPRRRSHDPSKEIYSLYGPHETGPETSVTDWMTQAADRVLWNDDGSSSSSSRPRHWKDAMEERFDQLLGLEGPSESYRRWAEEEEDSKSRRPRRKQKRASLFALITGRSLDGGGRRSSSSLDPLLENVWATGSMLSIGKLIVWSGARYFGLACRWASVRGAVPQPIVALLVASVALSARQRRLWWTALALCVLRAVGEAITEAKGASSVSRQRSRMDEGDGEEDWEDEGDEETDDETRD